MFLLFIILLLESPVFVRYEEVLYVELEPSNGYLLLLPTKGLECQATVKRFLRSRWCNKWRLCTHTMRRHRINTYVDMIDQTTNGHKFITEQFNVTPRIAWQIDLFVHSAAQTYLLGQRFLLVLYLRTMNLHLFHFTLKLMMIPQLSRCNILNKN